VRVRSKKIETPRAPGRDVFSTGEWDAIVREASLSPREIEILRHIFDDEKESVIAAALGVSPHTVHTHLERLYRKLGVSGRCAAVVRVVVLFRDLEKRKAPAACTARL